MNPKAPKPWEVRTARFKTGFNLQEAADIVYVSKYQWNKWEKDYGHKDHEEMPPAIAELFALKTGLKPLDFVWVLEEVDE